MADRLTNVGTEIDPSEWTHPTLRFLRSYWETKRQDRAMPTRADIRPSELRDHQGWVLMIEALPGMEDFRFRLIGTLVTQYFLSDSTGKTVSEAMEHYGHGVVKAVQAVLRRTAREKRPLRAYGDAGWIGPGFEEFEGIYLPLSDDGETVNMILHGFVFDRPKVMLAREIARAHGGKLQTAPPKPRRPD